MPGSKCNVHSCSQHWQFFCNLIFAKTYQLLTNTAGIQNIILYYNLVPSWFINNWRLDKIEVVHRLWNGKWRNGKNSNYRSSCIHIWRLNFLHESNILAWLMYDFARMGTLQMVAKVPLHMLDRPLARSSKNKQANDHKKPMKKWQNYEFHAMKNPVTIRNINEKLSSKFHGILVIINPVFHLHFCWKMNKLHSIYKSANKQWMVKQSTKKRTQLCQPWQTLVIKTSKILWR